MSAAQEEQIRDLYAQGKGSPTIAKAVGINSSLVYSNLKQMGVSTRTRSEAAAMAHVAREHPDRTIDANGYVLVKVATDDPHFAMAFTRRRTKAVRARWVPEHRLVMARHLGRSLNRSETVHHINGVRHDNRLENLQLRVGRHGSGQVAACRSCGSRDIAFEEIASA